MRLNLLKQDLALSAHVVVAIMEKIWLGMGRCMAVMYLFLAVMTPHKAATAGCPAELHAGSFCRLPERQLWGLRSLCGLKNTLNTNIIAIGGAGAWSQPADVTGKHVSEKYRFNIHEFSYDDLGKLIIEAVADEAAVSRARRRAGDYLRDSGVSLETNREFVDNCFVLEDVMKRVRMAELKQFRTALRQDGWTGRTLNRLGSLPILNLITARLRRWR